MMPSIRSDPLARLLCRFCLALAGFRVVTAQQNLRSTQLLEASSSTSGSSRHLFQAGQRSAIDSASPVQTIVSQRLTDRKAIIRYQNEHDGKLIEFRVAERIQGTNSITMHDPPVTVTRLGSDESQTPNAALANVGNNQVVSCELVVDPTATRTQYSITCALISFDDASNSLTVGSWYGFPGSPFEYPTFPESIFLARLGSGKALACYQIENWEQNGITWSRNDNMKCRSITVDGTSLNFGKELVLSSDRPDDMAMAELDLDQPCGVAKTCRALVCYSDKGTTNYCRILALSSDGQLAAGTPVNMGPRQGTYTASPCVVSRLTDNQGLACCEKPSSIGIPGRSYLECSILFASGTHGLDTSGGSSFGSTTLTVDAAFFSKTNAEAMVHVKNDNSGAFGKTEICYQGGSDQTKLTCDTLQVKEEWSWLSWAYKKYLKIKSKDRYQFSDLDGTYTGRFFSLEKLNDNGNPADLLACYREKAGPGQCNLLTR